MKIQQFIPSAALTPFVKAFMIIETDLETASKIIPDTSMVMSFRYAGKVLKVEGGHSEAFPASVISGLRRSVRHFCYSKATANLLVIFNEGGMTAFSGIPSHKLFEQSISSENLFHISEINEILERLAEAKTNRNRIDIIETFLLKKLTLNKQSSLIDTAVSLIKQQSGVVRIKDLAASLYISQDAFEKRFRAAVGATPKQYASIIRLRNLISKYPSYDSLTDASYEAGYFDQSHFIKDFRQFTGQAPKEFFKSPQYW